MFWHTTAQYNNTRFLGSHSQLIKFLNILNDINNELIFERVCEKNISNGSICKSWTVDGYIIFPTPIVDAFWIIYFFAKSLDHSSWSPKRFIFFLLFEHCFKKLEQKGLKFDIVLVRN